MNKKYKFVVATPYSESEYSEKCQISVSLDKLGLTNQTTVFFNNEEGLSKLYNTFITEENRGTCVVFVHHDVIIDDVFILEKLQMAFESFDVVGLAGSKQCNISSDITAWHLMSPRDAHVGEVAHSKDKQTWTTVFGPTPSRALLIDGVFIAVNVDKLLETNTRFDEEFEFHHYDLAFSLIANRNKVKIGVYPIRCTHFGLGDSMNSTNWHDSNVKFKKKYCK